MKIFELFTLTTILILASCSSIRVTADYDTEVNFKKYKTFAFYKKGIDKASISDLDKRRILRAVEIELLDKGLKKSDNPDILVSIFTKSRKQVDVRTNAYYGNTYWYPNYYWHPYYYGENIVSVSQYTEGTLFIDFIDSKEKQLIWQGIGTGVLRMKNPPEREEKIKLFVREIMMKYPPEEN